MKTIRPDALQQLLMSDPALALIDVRTPEEFAEMHVPQARNEPLDQFKPQALIESGAFAKNQQVYLLCRSGGRATQAAEKMAQAGFDQGVVVEGGTQGWVDAGLPVARGKVKAISIEGQVRIIAGSVVLLGLVLAYFVHPAFLTLPALVGVGLVLSGATGLCGLALLLAKAPWNSRP